MVLSDAHNKLDHLMRHKLVLENECGAKGNQASVPSPSLKLCDLVSYMARPKRDLGNCTTN